MPYKCSVPNCKGNYTSDEKVHVFSFPSDPVLKEAWERAIPRKHFQYTKNSKVCQKHFMPEDVELEATIFDDKSGKNINIPLLRPRLKKGAVPKIFPGCPSYLNNSTTARKSPEAKRKKKEEKSIANALRLSILSNQKYEDERKFCSFVELLSCIKKYPYSNSIFWDIIERPNAVFFLNLDISKEATNLIYAIQINEQLELSVSFRGEPITVLNGCKYPMTVKSINDIHNVLRCIESKSTDNINELPINKIIHMLQSLIENLNTTENERQHNILTFIIEQLQLLNLKPQQYRYSPNMLIFSSLFYLISPTAYKFTRYSDNFILPHPSTIHKLCETNSNIKNINGPNFLAYAKQKIETLNFNDRYVSLMIDEIHIKPYLDFKGGNITGYAEGSTNLAKTAYVFMIQSIFSKFKDVVYILPSNSMCAEKLFPILKEIIMELEKISFKVVIVVTDNNSINSKTMSLFLDPPEISYTYPHPIDKTRPLFFCIDSVHLIKCIRNNWLNQKNSEQAMYFPNFDISKDQYCTASLKTVKNLYEHECGKLLKFGYTLSRKALWPTTMERQNVKLALNLFNSHVAQSLLDLGTPYQLLNFESTANYINIMKKWFDIMNVKTVSKGAHSLNDMCNPLSFSKDNPQIIFLTNFLNWLDKWKVMPSDTGRLSTETHTALILTTKCIIEITKYIQEELNMDYLLTGRIQTDELEYRFSLYRRLAGTQYHISMRQILEVEHKLRMKSLLRLKLKTSNGEILIDKIIDDNTHIQIEDCNIKDIFYNINVTEDISDINDSLPIIAYLAGYCAHSYLKRYKCTNCKENIVTDKTLDTTSVFQLIHASDRGGLLFPDVSVINCVAYVFVIIQKLVGEKYEYEFIKVQNQRALATYLAFNILKNNELLIPSCNNGHSSKLISTTIIRSATNTFLNNYCKSKTDENLKSKKSYKS